MQSQTFDKNVNWKKLKETFFNLYINYMAVFGWIKLLHLKNTTLRSRIDVPHPLNFLWKKFFAKLWKLQNEKVLLLVKCKQCLNFRILFSNLFFFHFECCWKGSFHGAVLWTKLDRWRLPFKRFKVRSFTRGVRSKSAGTTANCCWQEPSKLYFLNKKHF